MSPMVSQLSHGAPFELMAHCYAAIKLYPTCTITISPDSLFFTF